MRRRHLVEFEDLRWFPALLRNYMTDYLRYVADKFDLFTPVAPVLVELLRRTGCVHILDLGSGGGGQWRTLVPRLNDEIADLRLTLSDLYPNRTALSQVAALFPDIVTVAPDPVDVRAVPADLAGTRTLFLCLHHFRPPKAQAILQNAVAARAPIAIFEAQRRDVEHVARFALSPLMVLLFTPFIRPVRLSRLALTYLLPLVPFFVFWDGVVSVLRTYTMDEMLEMARAADEEVHFAWQAGVLTTGQLKIPYLLGWPRVREDGST
jgi:SAM-dependent methyltransferase